jgi:formyltetrahydrofolate deformylase
MSSKPPPRTTATLLMQCPDRKGLVYRIAEFLYRNEGNILHDDQHTDLEAGLFFSRVEWDLAGFKLSREEIGDAFAPIAREHGMEWELRFSDERPRIALFVSKLDHCLVDLLHRWSIGELHGEIVAVVSNHPDLRAQAESRGLPFHVFPITAETKREQEDRELQLLAELRVDLVVLARYMQVVTERFVERHPNRVINIHHSFLPAFVGANPYARAHERGVKLIGATSHYVTPALDQGPIIEQDVVRVSHRDSVADLVRKGRDLERIVLARGVRLHLERRVLAYGNKTVVFD